MQSDLGPTFDGTKPEWPLPLVPIKWPNSSRLQPRPENLNFDVKSFMDAAKKYKEKVNDGNNSQERVNIKNTSTKTQQLKKTMVGRYLQMTWWALLQWGTWRESFKVTEKTEEWTWSRLVLYFSMLCDSFSVFQPTGVARCEIKVPEG